MMRVAARAANKRGGSFVRPIGATAPHQHQRILWASASSTCATTMPTDRRRQPRTSSRMLMAVAAVVTLRPLFTMAEGRTDDSNSTLQYPTGKPCPSYGCPLFPVDIVQIQPKDNSHNQRHEPTVLTSLAEIRNSTRQELQVENNKNHIQTLSTTASSNQATVTMTGFKGGPATTQINQDRSLVVSPYYLSSEQETTPRVLLGVMDGHATRGEVVSEYVVTELPTLLATRLQEAFSAKSGVVDEEVETTKRVLSEVFIELDKTSPADPSGGCTCSVIFRQGDYIYIANAGDSVSMVAVYQKSNKSTRIVYESREDKPHLPDERQRVEDMGGYVYVPPRGTSRVIHVNPRTGAQTGLAMSRSIGDWAFGKLGVIPDPIVDVLHIPTLLQNATRQAQVDASDCWTIDDDGVVVKKEDCEDEGDSNDSGAPTTSSIRADDFAIFAVSATDGMMDYVAKDGIVTVVAQSLFEPDGTHPATACELLVNAAASGWEKYRQGRYRDDIAIAVATLSEAPETIQEETNSDKESGSTPSAKEEL